MGMKLLFVEIQAGAAVPVVLLMRLGMRKLPRVYSYMLWLVVFARLLIPVSFESRFGMMPSAAGIGARQEENLNLTGMGIGQSSAGGIAGSGAGTREETDPAAGGNQGSDKMTGAAEADLSVSTVHMAGDSGKEEGKTGEAKTGEIKTGETGPLSSGGTEVCGYREFSVVWKTVLPILWAAGAAAILAYNGAALLRVKKQVKSAERLRDNVYTGSRVESPFTLGLIRPKIYLPSDLTEAEQGYIICHEGVHIRRKDYLVKNTAFLLTALHWFNPFVCIAFSYWGKDMELSCDEKVIRKMGEEIKRQYSQSLLRFAQGKIPTAMAPVTFGDNSVKQRVSNVLAYKAAPRWAAVLGIAVILASAAMTFTVRSDAARQESGSASDTDLKGQIPAKNSVPAVKEVGASPEILRTGSLLAQGSPYAVLERWAKAYTDRNGNILYQLAADKEGFQQWDRVTRVGDGGYAFGDSSPWPWENDYEIVLAPEGSAAEITFHMRTSVPEIYLVREKVRITEADGLYYVDHESTWDNYSIDTGQEYEDAYDRKNGYAEMAFLYEDAFYRAILAQLLDGDNKGYYQRYTDPVTAALALLHLGAGEGEVAEWHMVPATQLRSADTEFPEWASIPAPDWSLASSASGVGSRVIVAYTFARDGSRVEIPMELKEESQGIWGLAGGSIREAYGMVSQPEMIDHEEGKADLTYVIELSNYGIYRFGAHSGLTCLWVGDVGQEADVRVSQGRLYIFPDQEHAGENSVGGEEKVFVYDLLTGELYREPLPVSRNKELSRINFADDVG